MVEQWAWMMMIFRCLILLALTFNIQTKTIDYTFTVDGSDLSFTDLSADYESKNYLRNSIWKLFVVGDNGNKFQRCWNSYLTNKKITYSISGTTLSIESISNNTVTYKYSFNLNKLKNLNVSKVEYLNYCNNLDNKSLNDEVIEDNTKDINNDTGYQTSTNTFDPEDI